MQYPLVRKQGKEITSAQIEECFALGLDRNQIAKRLDISYSKLNKLLERGVMREAMSQGKKKSDISTCE